MTNYEELMNFINQLDTAHLLTYYWACILIVAVLLGIYCILGTTFSLIVRKKRTKYLENVDKEAANKCREYASIGIFTKVDKK